MQNRKADAHGSFDDNNYCYYRNNLNGQYYSMFSMFDSSKERYKLVEQDFDKWKWLPSPRSRESGLKVVKVS